MVKLGHCIEEMGNQSSTVLYSRCGDIGVCNTKETPPGQNDILDKWKRISNLWPIEKVIPLLVNSVNASITPGISGAPVIKRTAGFWSLSDITQSSLSAKLAAP